ncbi:MAG TPA: molecular chaperone DnaJ [Anaerolineales bacterium]|nr:molecular chaperone DnaJ [Anaerolineales bacterium]
MAKADYYETLGVGKNATPNELKSAFRNLARRYHPDVSQEPDAEERFKEINEAYAVLADTEKRAAYDRFGHAGVNGMGGVDFTNVDLSDILGDLFSSFGFGGFGRTRGRNAPRRGEHLQYTLTIEFEESVAGVEKEIVFARDEVCSHCSGNRAEPGTKSVRCETCSGQGEVRQHRQSLFGTITQVTTCPTCIGSGERIETPCRTCSGRGLERVTVKKVVTIPAGVDNGNQIRLPGEGQPGSGGGPRGDLYILVRVLPHKFFRRRNDDIHIDLNVNVAQAALGADVTVPTVDGDEQLPIPAGTQPGKVIKMRGKGIPDVHGSGRRGDQLVLINVVIPSRLSDDQRALFEQLAESLGTEVKPGERGFFDTLKDVLGL